MASSDLPRVLKPVMKSAISTESLVVSISTRARNLLSEESVNCENSTRLPA